MAKDGNGDGPDLAQPGAIGKEWQAVATHFTEIAPRRSAVRARLAPSKRASLAALFFRGQRGSGREDSLIGKRFGKVEPWSGR